MNKLQEVVDSNPEILGGKPVFRGTRVPVSILFQHLEKGIALEVFLDDFPTVAKEQAVTVLSIVEDLLGSHIKLSKLYEIAA